MKTLLIPAALAAALLASPAVAQEGGYYVGAKVLIGLSNVDGQRLADGTPLRLEDDRPEGVAGPSLSFGYRMKRFPIRLETEWIWRYRFDLSTHDGAGNSQSWNVGTHSIAWNAFYDFPPVRGFTGYVGGGAGLALTTSQRNRGVGPSDTEAGFTWMASAGTRYQLSPHWLLDFSYRYSDLGEIDTGEVETDSYTSHDIMLGVVYAF